MLGYTLVLKAPLLLNERDAPLLGGLVVHRQPVLFGSLVEAICLFKELRAILFSWNIQSFQELGQD